MGVRKKALKSGEISIDCCFDIYGTWFRVIEIRSRKIVCEITEKIKVSQKIDDIVDIFLPCYVLHGCKEKDCVFEGMEVDVNAIYLKLSKINKNKFVFKKIRQFQDFNKKRKRGIINGWKRR